MAKYTIEELQQALSGIAYQSDEMSDLFRALLKEKIGFLKAVGRKQSNKSLQERRAEYQRKWRAKGKEVKS